MVHTFGDLKRVSELLKEETLEYGVIEYDEEEDGNWV
jgi:hypothetical protein